MKGSRNRVYLLLALLCTSCGELRESREVTIKRSFPASGIRRIEVREMNGSVNVSTSDAAAISLVAHVRSRGVSPKNAQENQGYFESRLLGDTLTIENQRRFRVRFPFFSHNELSIDYELQVPSTVALEVRTVNGRITARGVGGETDVTTVNGAIDLESPGSSEIEARTVNGKLTARFSQGFQGAHLKTVNGTVHAVLPPQASFSCELSQVNGDFEASFPLNIHSNPRGRRVSGQVNGGRFPLRIMTVNGDIRVENGAALRVEGIAPAIPLPGTVPSIPGSPLPPAPPPPPIP